VVGLEGRCLLLSAGALAARAGKWPAHDHRRGGADDESAPPRRFACADRPDPFGQKRKAEPKRPADCLGPLRCLRVISALTRPAYRLYDEGHTDSGGTTCASSYSMTISRWRPTSRTGTGSVPRSNPFPDPSGTMMTWLRCSPAPRWSWRCGRGPRSPPTGSPG